MLRARSLLSAARLIAGFLSPRSGLGRGWDEALSIAQSGAVEVVSLDCFGTLLARENVDWEQRILAETIGSEAGYSAVQSRQFLKTACVKAKHLAGGDEEPTAESVWTEYCTVLGIQDMGTRLCAEELTLLEITSNPVDEALRFVAAVERLQLPWIVCSDTRWPAPLLTRLLVGKGFPVPLGSVFCSCDHRRNKFRGGLYSIAYKHLIETLGPHVLPSRILHVGDNFLADNCSAARFGMGTVSIPSTESGPGQVTTTESAKAHLAVLRRNLAESLR